MSIRYSVGEWSGVLARDKISIIDSKNITEPVVTEFALIKTSENFFISGAQWEGILGMAYSSLAKVRAHKYIIKFCLSSLVLLLRRI